MKTLFKYLLTLITFLSVSVFTNAQSNHPIYDYGDTELAATASIPDYEQAEQKLKISGTVYKSDGKTPAKDVIIYVYQTDENGKYEVKGGSKADKYIYHRAWLKTDENGKYTFYTFIPGTDYGSNEMKHIHTFIKEPSMPEYQIDGFLFDDDPYLSKYCRKRLKKSGATNILNPKKVNDILEAERDIILNYDQMASR